MAMGVGIWCMRPACTWESRSSMTCSSRPITVRASPVFGPRAEERSDEAASLPVLVAMPPANTRAHSTHSAARRQVPGAAHTAGRALAGLRLGAVWHHLPGRLCGRCAIQRLVWPSDHGLVDRPHVAGVDLPAGSVSLVADQR